MVRVGEGSLQEGGWRRGQDAGTAWHAVRSLGPLQACVRRRKHAHCDAQAVPVCPQAL